MLGASSSFGAIIFQDNFNRADSNTVGNGWVELENDNNDVRIRNNQLRLRDFLPGNPDAAATRQFSTVGFTDIYLDLRWAPLTSSEGSDDFFVDWSADGSTWTQIFASGLGGSGFSSVSLGPLVGAGGNDPFFLRLWTDVSRSNEGASIDAIAIRGTAVPEPGLIGLLLVGLFGMGIARAKARS